MYFGFLNREDLLRHLPKGGEIAEIGVATGQFSRSILETVKPDRLHLIDPWQFQDRKDYLQDTNNCSAAEQELRYEAVKMQFWDQIRSGQVVIHRDYAENVAPNFSDHQFDWIYIDGMHTYSAVKNDLETYASKVKPGGLILGHDYAENAYVRSQGFGVVPAVNEFVLSKGWQFVLLTNERYPTYVLASPKAENVLTSLIFPLMVEFGGIHLPDHPHHTVFDQKILKDSQGRLGSFFEFRAR